MSPYDSIEVAIWVSALQAALERASSAETRHERLAALEAVEEARERLGELLDAARDAILGPDRDALVSHGDVN